MVKGLTWSTLIKGKDAPPMTQIFVGFLCVMVESQNNGHMKVDVVEKYM